MGSSSSRAKSWRCFTHSMPTRAFSFSEMSHMLRSRGYVLRPQLAGFHPMLCMLPGPLPSGCVIASLVIPQVLHDLCRQHGVAP